MTENLDLAFVVSRKVSAPEGGGRRGGDGGGGLEPVELSACLRSYKPEGEVERQRRDGALAEPLTGLR